MDRNRGIGINNALPWHLPADLKRFKELTSGNCVIMGRKTYESIGRPLPNRRNIVITRDTNWRADGVEVVYGVVQAIAATLGYPAFIIGGSEIYQQALPYVGKLLLTEIDHVANCDAFFPEIDRCSWVETSKETHPWVAGVDYSFVTYTRK